MPGVVAVGSKRVDEESKIYSMGEFMIHPKGFHYLGKGLPLDFYRFPEEIDVLTGGLLVIEEKAFERAGGESMLQGQLGIINLMLMLRKAGGRCVSMPQVLSVDTHPILPTIEEEIAFTEHWGFDWQAADLDTVREIYVGTGLLWNTRFHAEGMPFEKYIKRSAFHWKSYCEVPPYQQRANNIIATVLHHAPKGKILDLGCGDGLYTHLAALNHAEVLGVDPEDEAIALANKMTADMSYPSKPPTFIKGQGGALTCLDASFDLVMMLDVIEHLHNPVCVLSDVSRTLKPGGYLFLTTPEWKFSGCDDPHHISEYSKEELTRQVKRAAGLETLQITNMGGIYRDIVLLAKKATS